MASEALAGRLLVATPMLGDPNFRRTVVLVVEHEPEQGTLGVVLNRPTEVPVGQVLEPWTELVTGPSVVNFSSRYQASISSATQHWNSPWATT